MSESFSDLWASSNPVKSQQAPPPKTLGAAAHITSSVTLNTPPDAFSLLASVASSRPSSRPITPSSIKPSPVTIKNGTNTTDDAFGGLVSFGASTSHDDGLTIAERAVKAERERRQTTKDEAAFNLQASSLNPPASNDAWNFDFLISERTSSPSYQSRYPDKATLSSDSHDTWDLDFISSEPAIPVTSKKDNDDDILGYLAKPVDALRSISPQPPHKPPSPMSMKQSPHPSSESPPPHVIGKIVEMGFSVQEAKVALAATSTGLDVEAAVETLLQSNVTASCREEEQNDMPAGVDRPLPQHRDPSHAIEMPRHPSSPSLHPAHPASSSAHQQGLQEQADKLLSQASTIGITMFNKANAFWKDGRDKLVKAYEEQRSKNAGADAGLGKVRPRWMDGARVDEDGQDDSLDESYDQRAPTQRTHSTPDPIPSKKPVLLFVDEKPVYRSPARRRPPESASTSKAPSPSPIPATAASQPVGRQTIEASPSALAASSAHKATGTEHFRLGRFAEAEAAYSRAIDALPGSHLLRIPLYNNRALTRLKTGEYNGTIDDTSAVLHIITGDLGTAWHPGREAVAADENLGDAFGKAIRRRAEAYEGLEKWKEAANDWERLSATEWIGQALKGNAMNGAGRCRRLADGGNGRPSSSNFSEPKRMPTRTQTSGPGRPGWSSEALSRVRAANTAQEKEDQARHDLKDTVDSRLAAWRAGKETNIRALIASLDMVLSPTFRWQKVGMAELVSSGQVKTHYTKAIARLHPDKLNVNNTTLEERMVANGVFGSLNEAWNVFR